MPIVSMAALLAVAQQPTPSPGATVPGAPYIIDQYRPDRVPVAPVGEQQQPSASLPRGSATVEAAASGAPIRHINFGGTKVPAVVADAARPFLGKTASLATLQALAKAMSDAYAKSDVALYTLLIPQQSLEGGDIRITVVEGHVERVVFVEGETPLLRAYAKAIAAEKPLTRITLQRYLSLMRDVPGATIDVQLLRGVHTGGVVLQIKAKRRRVQLTASYDNQGVGALGQSQVRTDAHAYSLLRDGDRTDLTGLVSPDLDRLRYISLSHSTPIGADGATLTGSAGYLRTRPRGVSVDGDARTFGLTAAYPVIRSYLRNLTVTLGVDGIDSDAAVLGSTFSADHTRAARLAAGFSQVGTKAVFTAGLTASRGLGILNARATPGVTEVSFSKLNGRVTYDRQISPRLFVHLRAAGQYSRDKLAAVERFAVGGADFGRAFDLAFLAGDKGAAGSAELAVRPKLPGPMAGTELYGFVDGATVGFTARPPFPSANYDLASAGGGVRLAYTSRASLTLEGAKVIDDPYPGYRGNWRVNVAWRLSMKK